MSLSTGSVIGHYEILGPLGSGSMGEVYRARNCRLGSEVAIKMLKENLCRDADGLHRFQQEAQAAGALNHPNLLVVHDLGMHEGRPFLVTELLEGESLAARLARSPIPPRRAVEYAIQIAKGLAATHAKGIVHRDLKPSNLFITDAGVVKILDFGLAKVSRAAAAVVDVNAPTIAERVGTPGYIPPEQVFGRPADQRSDIFSFGAVLYEMLSGRRAFAGDDGMNATVKEDPAPLPASVPAPLEHLVRRCLEKRPEDRFHSAHDLILALESVVPAPPPPFRFKLLAGVAAALCCAILAAIAWRIFWSDPVVYTKLTSRHGTVGFARFTADGTMAMYSAAWDAKPARVYATRTERGESWPVDISHVSNPLFMAVSSAGELAFLLPHEGFDPYRLHGTLARVPLAGGEPKEIAEDVASVDWSPDGSKLAVARVEKSGSVLEYPIETVLYRTAGWIDYVRVSPAGDQVAFLDHPLQGDLGGAVAVVSATSGKRILSPRYNSIRGLAWTSGGREIWFSAAAVGDSMALYSVTLQGKTRRLEDLKGYATLEDISRDGRALVINQALRRSMIFVPGDSRRQVDLYYSDASQVQDLARDGSAILFAESGTVTGRDFEVFLKGTDGSSGEKRLGTGLPMAISPDGKWAIANPSGEPAQLVLLPTGAGTERPLTRDSIHHIAAQWTPGGGEFVFVGRRPGAGLRYWIQSTGGGEPREITREDVQFDRSSAPIVISPDGRELAALDSAGRVVRFPAAGGAGQPVKGAAAGDVPLQWCRDQGLIVRRAGAIPVELDRIDLASGRRAPWRSLAPDDVVALVSISPVRVSADCRSCAYSTLSVHSIVYAVSGLR